MSPRSFAAVFTVALLLVGVLPAAALGGVSGGPETRTTEFLGERQTLASQDSSVEPGEVEMRIDVAADGDARWRVTTAVSIENGDDRAAFEELVEEFNRSESPLGLDTFRKSAANASRATGRQMAIEDIERHHATRNETGLLWVTFTWTSFGNRTGDRLAVDDGFDTESGVWLPSLSGEETLVVVPPEGYGVSSAPTGTSSAPSSLTDGVARWEGPQDFGQRGPWIVYSGDAPVPTPTTAGPAGTGTGTGAGPTTGGGPPGGDGDGGLADALPLVVLLVVAGAGAVVVGLYVRGDDDGLGAFVTDGTDGSGSSAADTASPSSPSTDAEMGATDGSSPSVGESAANGGSDAGSAAAGAGAAAAGGSEGDGDIDEELLSDEERVERLIEQNGGRMKQAAIVRKTGWSNAKVSQLLSTMDDEGRIDKLRIGRENLISFPDEDVADFDSK